MAHAPPPRRAPGRFGALVEDVRHDPLPAGLLAVALIVLAVTAVVIGSEVVVPVAIVAVALLVVASVSAERRRRGTHVRARAPARVETFPPDEDQSGTDPGGALTRGRDRS